MSDANAVVEKGPEGNAAPWQIRQSEKVSYFVTHDSLNQTVASVIIDGQDWISGEKFLPHTYDESGKPTIIKLVGKEGGFASALGQGLEKVMRDMVGEPETQTSEIDKSPEMVEEKEVHFAYDSKGRLSSVISYTKAGAIANGDIQKEVYFPSERRMFQYDSKGRVLTDVTYDLEDGLEEQIKKAVLYRYSEPKPGTVRIEEIEYHSIYGHSEEFEQKYPQTKGIPQIQTVWVKDIDVLSKRELKKQRYETRGFPRFTTDEHVQRYPQTTPLDQPRADNLWPHVDEFPDSIELPTFIQPSQVTGFEKSGQIPLPKEQLITPDKKFLLVEELLGQIESGDNNLARQLVIDLFEENIVLCGGLAHPYTPYAQEEGMLKLRERVSAYSPIKKLIILIADLQGLHWTSYIKEKWREGQHYDRHSLDSEMIPNFCTVVLSEELEKVQEATRQIADEGDHDRQRVNSLYGIAELVEAWKPRDKSVKK